MRVRSPDLQLFDPNEVSEMTRGKVSPWTLRRLAREGRIACVRGERGKLLFSADQVRALLEEWTVPARPVATVVAPLSPEEYEDGVLAFRGTARARRARGF